MSAGYEQTDVMILGGGMVGLGMACALKDTGLHVVLIERGEAPVRESLGRDCRVSAIVRGNVEILQGLGVWRHLERVAQPIRSMRIWENQASGGIRFDAAEINKDALGFLVENSQTQKAMHKTLLDAPHVEICCPAEVSQIEWTDEHVRLVLADGRKLKAPLIVGADGGRSWLREQAGIACHQRDYHQKGIVATVKPQRPHGGIAYQRFLPTGPLAMLPMTGNLCSIVWSAEEKEADRLMAMDDKAFLEALNATFGPVLGRIEEAGKRAAFPLKGQLAKHLVRPRLALIGDAAHTIHPLAGLGVNLGLRDAMVLAQEIADAKRFDEDWGGLPVLNRYMKLRLPDVMSVMGSMEGFHQLFTHDLPGLQKIRGLGMRLVGNSGPIKQLLMRNSTGLSLPVPRQIS
jgi:ubiquinone biosynthesis UbiH/UbiF/VisC/COQ6 family hydroxylase